ncbi:DUF418 domain-containing protein [Pseudoclavibacter sp. 8L]|uniref:DUF418 domain-containing protein n=1 Tax=Pseudoclavibacter sp. 8L TaxID=2653162 RepID=UPI0012F06DDA|nr:DUF418 domain-containing protein [Pseudoclavibacter sp. 8L]VXB86898.1 conserved membrane hypothetical protein [Pseudoclavibacter sp. 8L]
MTTTASSGSAPAAQAPVAPAPTPISERAIAPDLARGMMLLLIALAHTPWFLFTSEIGVTLMHPADGDVADRIAQAFTIIVVDTRTHTMFGFLFAYGIWQLYSRQVSKGLPAKDARRLLRTRHWWLLAFGLVHAVLLWQGDILGTYGLIGLLMVPLFFNRSDTTLKVWIGVFLAVGLVFSVGSFFALQMLPPGPAVPNLQQPIIAERDFLTAMLLRVAAWFPGLLSGVASLALPTAFLFGLLAARHRVLEEPGKHLPLLRIAAFGGIAVGWSAGVIQVLAHFGMLEVPNPAAFGSVHFFTGIFAGVGYAAAFGLIAHGVQSRGARLRLPGRALLALGRRSLSGYLSQSIIFVPLLSAWGLALGAHLSSWSAMLVAIGAWMLTVAAAYLLDRRGVRGPAEVALRKLSYRTLRKRS